MGQKGDKHTNEASLSAELLLEKLDAIEGITSKKMFGGYGVFHNEKMFAIIDSKGHAFFKTDPSNEQEFIDSGSIRHTKMPYHSISEFTLQDTDRLIALARKSIAISK